MYNYVGPGVDPEAPRLPQGILGYPEYIEMMDPFLKKKFKFRFNKYGVAFRKSGVNQLGAFGTHMPINRYQSCISQCTQEDEYERQDEHVSHCATYNNKIDNIQSIFAHEHVTPTAYKPRFPKHSNPSLVRTPSTKYLTEQYIHTVGSEEDWLTNDVNSRVCDGVIIDWSFNNASRYKDDRAKCKMNIRGVDGHLIMSIYQQSPSLLKAKVHASTNHRV